MYKRDEQNLFEHIDFVILDSIMMQIAFAISYMFRHGFDNPYASESYRQMAIITGVLLIVVSLMSDGYKDILRRGYWVELRQCAKIVTIVVLLSVAYLFVVQDSGEYSRVVLLMNWAIGWYLIYIEHIIWKSVLVNRMRNDADQRQILMVASDVGMARDAMKHFEEREACDFRVVCITSLDEGDSAEQIKGIPLLSDLSETLNYISAHVVDEVFIYTVLERDVPEEFLEDCLNMGVVVHQNVKAKLPYRMQQEVSRLGEYVVITACISSATPRQLFLKRTMDIAGSLVGLILAGIAFIFVAPIILIQSPGPVIFKQQRVGKNGRPFFIYKFRSMYMDAEERKSELMEQNTMSGPIAKFENDPRIFPFGRFMRKWSIDELPQFWNVLKGSMSLVGTRPPTMDEYEQYELHHKKRLAAKPGLTGMWQVSGRSDVKDFEEIIRLDAQYITEWKLSLDIKILCYTVVAVFRKKGAE